MKEFLKNLPYFGLVCLWILGAFGGLGWALYNKSYLIAVAVAALAAMAVPTLLKAIEHLTGKL